MMFVRARMWFEVVPRWIQDRRSRVLGIVTYVVARYDVRYYSLATRQGPLLTR